jgi:ABC-type sugar transport system ATPase subunit
MAAVDCEHLDKTYPTGTRALVDCTLHVDDGELLVLVGPSGCGKSTLLRLIAGLENATGGTLRIGGRIANDLSPRARNVAMVFQDYALYPHMTVRKNLEYPLRMRAMARDAMNARVQNVAGLLEIGAVMDRLPRELSGGQRQRVAMGRALVREPAVFLLDEPLSNLDAKLRQEVRGEIAALQRRTGTTMIYVTHDQTEAMTLGKRVAVLDKGVLEQIAPPRELYERPANVFVAGFIGTPPMNLFRTTLARDGAGTFSLAVGAQRVRVRPQPAVAAALERTPPAEITVGIRPEHVSVADGSERPSGGSAIAAVRGTVDQVECLGHETLARIDASGARLTVRVAGMPALRTGEQLTVTLDSSSLHFFDASGRAVR